MPGSNASNASNAPQKRSIKNLVDKMVNAGMVEVPTKELEGIQAQQQQQQQQERQANLNRKKSFTATRNRRAAALESQLKAKKPQQLNVYLTGLVTRASTEDENAPTILTRFIDPLLASAPKAEELLPEENKTPRPEMTLRDVRTLRVAERTQHMFTKYIQGKYIARNPDDNAIQMFASDPKSTQELHDANILIYFIDVPTVVSLSQFTDTNQQNMNQIKGEFSSLQKKPKIVFFLLEEPFRKTQEKGRARTLLETVAKNIFAGNSTQDYRVVEYQFPDAPNIHSVIEKEGHRQHFKAYYDAIEGEEKQLINDNLQKRQDELEKGLNQHQSDKNNANIASIQRILRDIALIQDVNLLDKTLSLFESFQNELTKRPKDAEKILSEYQEVAVQTLTYFQVMEFCNCQPIDINNDAPVGGTAKNAVLDKPKLTREKAIELSNMYYERCTKVSLAKQLANGLLMVISVALGAVLGCVAGAIIGTGMGIGLGVSTGGVLSPAAAAIGGGVGVMTGALLGGMAGYKLFLGNHGLGLFPPQEFYNKEVKSIRDYGLTHAKKLRSEGPQCGKVIAWIDKAFFGIQKESENDKAANKKAESVNGKAVNKKMK